MSVVNVRHSRHTFSSLGCTDCCRLWKKASDRREKKMDTLRYARAHQPFFVNTAHIRYHAVSTAAAFDTKGYHGGLRMI